MSSLHPVLVRNPPPLWDPVLACCRSLMRAFGAPAVVVEGRLLDTVFGPRIAATLGLPPAMGPVVVSGHPAYRAAMRDAAGLVTFLRMTALAASGIGPVTASTEPETALWQVIVLPAGVVLIARTREADFGPFLMTLEEPTARQADLVAVQLDFAGIGVGDEVPPGGTDGPSAAGRT
ncbi:hypothetical protein [Arenibaculum pallidiluteum]|uniref:hypothetical protein n=1 Tax=Arenibaculum pallidiluteum TaxID=2812559 RepID=UPI001A978179|nr:hypothetical protein [Arenibaculum pallidiluteum]